MEQEFIAWLRRRLPSHPLLKLGLGDDAAVLELRERADTLVTVDVLTDQVDFRLEEVDPHRVGRKALAVNLSDIAAMAGRPVAAVIGLVLPRASGFALATELYEGMLPLAEKYNVAIAGGDTNSWDGPLVIGVTLLGQVTKRGPLRRNGAKPGDKILVTGSFGGSILGWHFDFEPRVNEAILLNDRYTLHAGIDVSDGLSLDLSRLAAESGCGAMIEAKTIPISQAAHELAIARSDGVTPFDHALADGEDFELILAVSPDEADRILADRPLNVPITCIGEFVPEPGLWEVDPKGGMLKLEPRGYEHQFGP